MRIIAILGVTCTLMLSIANAGDPFSSLLKKFDYRKTADVDLRQVSGKINLEKVGTESSQRTDENTKPVSYTADCASGGCASGPNAIGGCASGQCGTGCGNGQCGPGGCGPNGLCGGRFGGGLCGSGSGFCTPHNTPNLPTSTLRQYWKSNSCNCNVWDGYQNRCPNPLFSKLANLGRNGHGNCCGGCGQAGCNGKCGLSGCDQSGNGNCDQSGDGGCSSGGCDTPVPVINYVGQGSCDNPSIGASPRACDAPGGMSMHHGACDGNGCNGSSCDAPGGEFGLSGSCDAPGGCTSVNNGFSLGRVGCDSPGSCD